MRKENISENNLSVEDILNRECGAVGREKFSGSITSLSDLGIEIPDYIVAQLRPKECYVNSSKICSYLSASGYNARPKYVTLHNKEYII